MKRKLKYLFIVKQFEAKTFTVQKEHNSIYFLSVLNKI